MRRSPTSTLFPYPPLFRSLFVFQFVDVRDENAMLLTTVFAPPPVVIVSFTADVVRPVGVVVINSVQFVTSQEHTSVLQLPGGLLRGRVRRPDTITYSTAAS